MSFTWSILSTPPGATASLDNAQIPTPKLTVNDDGTFVVQLIVSDGRLDSDPETVTLTATPAPTVSISSPTTTEGDSGTKTLTFQVRLSNAINRQVVVHYATANRTATAGSDYVAASGTVTFPANNAAPRNVNVTVKGDTTVETDETLRVALSNPTNAKLGRVSKGTGTITNDDTTALPTVSITTLDANASESGPDSGSIRVTRSGGNNTLALTVSTLRSGTAGNGSDYTAVGGTVTIPAGQASVDVTFTPIDDALVEGDETIVVTLAASSNYGIGTPKQATITIADNEGLPTVSITTLDANASENGPDSGSIRVTRSGGNNTLALTVSTLRSGTAGNGSDYTAVGGTVTIPAGQASVDVTFTPIDDALVEGDETIVVMLAASSNYGIGTPNSATITIVANDAGGPIINDLCVIDVDNRPNNASPYDSALIDLKDCVTGADQSTLQFFNGSGSEISAEFQFVPPVAKMTAFDGGNGAQSISSDDNRRQFSVKVGPPVDQTFSGKTLQIRFVGKRDEDFSNDAGRGDAVSFTSLRNALNTSCGGCHAAGSTFGWLGSNRVDGFKKIKCSRTAAENLAYVNSTTPASSAMVEKAIGNLSHGGGQILSATPPSGPLSAGQIGYRRLLQWIQQGAYDTEGTDQSCP